MNLLDVEEVRAPPGTHGGFNYRQEGTESMEATRQEMMQLSGRAQREGCDAAERYGFMGNFGVTPSSWKMKL